MENIIADIRAALEAGADEKTRSTSQNYFKEKIRYYGVRIPVVNKISKEFFAKVQSVPKSEIFSFCEELWQSNILEESFIACNWSYYIRERYQREDFDTFERWVATRVTNWAACDTLCNHSVGTFVEMFPEFTCRLREWTKSDNRWMKRAAAVTFIIPARKGLFPDDIFAIADALLTDSDDMVQKGYGWMLKAASEAHRDEVFRYVMNHKSVMPRTALRYAIEKMPPEMKAQAMAK